MKNMLTLASTVCLGLALTLTACGKDKKLINTEPAKAEPAATDPAKTDPAAAGEPKPDDKPKTGDKPAGGW